MSKATFLFAPAAFNLAETSRMVEIAKMEQVANLACLEWLGFAIRVPKSRDPSGKVQDAIRKLLCDENAKTKAAAFARLIAHWDGPRMAAEQLLDRYGGRQPREAGGEETGSAAEYV